MSSLHQRVVITGLGVISPLGRDLDSFWQNLSLGNSGVTQLECLPESGIPLRFGGESKCFTGAIEEFGPLDKALQRAIKKNQKVMCREIEMGVAACQLAICNSGLIDPDTRDPERTGIVYGSDYIVTRPEEYADGVSVCMNAAREYQMSLWPTVGRPQVNPLWLLKYLPNMPASHVAIYNDLRGPSNSVTIREASSASSIAEAAATIRRGAAEVMVAGATGSRLTPLRALHFSVAERLASHRADPGQMSRPFDIARDGAVLGEGAGALVLESYERAVARNAKIWGEVVAGAGSTVGPVWKGERRDSIRIAVRNVLTRLIAQAEQLGITDDPNEWHIHACGKSEPGPDISEALGIRDALGDNPIGVTSAKSYFGNLGAGSGAVEIIASCLALDHQELFPILNCTSLDPQCPIDAIVKRRATGSVFAHLSFSAQGQANGVLIRKV